MEEAVGILLDVEQSLAVLFPVLLAVLSLQLPDVLSVLVQELDCDVLDPLVGSSQEGGFDLFLLLVLFDEAVEFVVELGSKVELLVERCEAADYSLGGYFMKTRLES